MRRKTAIVLILGSSIGCVAGWFFACVWPPFLAPDHIACRIEQSIVVANDGDEPVTPETLYIQIPPDNERQQVDLAGVRPEGLQIVENGDVLTVSGFRPVMPGDELRIVYSMIVKARWTECLRRQEVTPSDTAAGVDIESDNDLIIKKAEELSGEAGSAEEKAYRFYGYVAGSIEFNAEMEPGVGRSALECLQRHEGVCGHKANLLTALCRASGIPARTVSGLILPKSEEAAQIGCHAWNEIYVSGQGWFFADPTFGSSILKRKQYWKHYDMHRIRTAACGRYDCFAATRDGLKDDSVPACEVLGFPRFLLTAKNNPVHKGLCVRGDKLTTRATWMNAPW